MTCVEKLLLGVEKIYFSAEKKEPCVENQVVHVEKTTLFKKSILKDFPYVYRICNLKGRDKYGKSKITKAL